jgi:hemolysin III
LRHLERKQRWRKLDHSAIYLLIAGTYTSFTLIAMPGAWGWSLFGVVWTLAVLGVVARTTVGFRYPRLSTFL